MPLKLLLRYGTQHFSGEFYYADCVFSLWPDENACTAALAVDFSKSASQDKLFLEPPKNLVRDYLWNKALPLQPLHPLLTKKNWILPGETQL